MYFNGLLIDVDDVLYDSTFWDRWLFKLLSHVGVVGSYICHEQVWKVDYLPEVNRGETDYWTVLRRYLVGVGLNEAQVTEVIASSGLRHRQFFSSRRLFPAARMSLLRLSGCLPVVLISNTFESGKQISSCLAKSGIGNNLFPIVTSRDVGQTMPGSAFFNAAVKKFGFNSNSKIGLVSNNFKLLAQAPRHGLSAVAVAVNSEQKFDHKFERFEQIALTIAAHQPPTTSRMAA